jgi:hypothetical protein
VAGVIGTWKHVGTDFLEVDADRIPRDFGPERAVVRTLVVELEAEALALEGDRGLQVLHDEVWCNRNEIHARSFARRPVLGFLGRGKRSSNQRMQLANDVFIFAPAPASPTSTLSSDPRENAGRRRTSLSAPS